MVILEETKQTILTSYSDVTKDNPLYKLSDERNVIGIYIDEGNHSHYVIRNEDGSCELTDAEEVHVSKSLQTPPTQTVTLSFPSK
jgi:hypothetical protein